MQPNKKYDANVLLSQLDDEALDVYAEDGLTREFEDDEFYEDDELTTF